MGTLHIECNGNAFTKLMHLLVFHELNRMRVNKELEINAIMPEKTVLMEKRGREREGRFDFLVQAKGKVIGIEVLTRPSHGKLKQKLPYANEVDEFIFVLPHDSMAFYRKKKMNGFRKQARDSFLSQDFQNPKLRAWMLDCQRTTFTEKGKFSKLFNIR